MLLVKFDSILWTLAYQHNLVNQINHNLVSHAMKAIAYVSLIYTRDSNMYEDRLH